VKTLALTAALLASSLAAAGQVAQQPPPVTSLPFASQLKNVVVLIETDCLYEPTPEELAGMSPTQRAKWTPEAVATLTPQQIATMKHVIWLGTGFIVQVTDPRLAPKFGTTAGYNYLVTNRHVAEPGIERGHPCRVVGRSIGANHKVASPTKSVNMIKLPIPIDGTWIYPQDDAVDLAVTSVNAPHDEWDYQQFDDSMFVSQDMIDQNKVVEGESVMFAGLFIQYIGGSRLEPIVRSGKIAMLPKEPMNTTLGKPGRVLLAEVHSFGGNSGSPVFVEVPVDRNSLAFKYRFLGVVAGEVVETSDLSLQTTASYKGNLQANSNISMIVPAEEVKKLLFLPLLVKERDDRTNKYLESK
jgi:hypothetical protein